MSTDRITSFTNGDLRFDVRDEGPLDGTPIVLLHGFPQRATCWNAVVLPLHEAGFRTFAPDQRGYSPGARPKSRFAYRIPRLVEDVKALVDTIGEPVHLVGHDWGAVPAWTFTANHGDQVRSLTAVSVGHPAAFLTSWVRSDQLKRSWYMGAFQFPVLPEKLLSRPGGRGERLLRKVGMTPEMIRTFRSEIVDDGALRGGLNWYRSLPLADPRQLGPVRVPTTLVWSDDDDALGIWQAERSAAHVEAPFKLVTIAGATHWLTDERPDEVAEAILERATA